MFLCAIAYSCAPIHEITQHKGRHALHNCSPTLTLNIRPSWTSQTKSLIDAVRGLRAPADQAVESQNLYVLEVQTELHGFNSGRSYVFRWPDWMCALCTYLGAGVRAQITMLTWESVFCKVYLAHAQTSLCVVIRAQVTGRWFTFALRRSDSEIQQSL